MADTTRLGKRDCDKKRWENVFCDGNIFRQPWKRFCFFFAQKLKEIQSAK